MKWGIFTLFEPFHRHFFLLKTEIANIYMDIKKDIPKILAFFALTKINI